MQLQQLIYFVTIAEQGSINKAAEKLFTTQPNLSKSISNLEGELKINIFRRTNKGVVLTDDGKKLYQYAHTILSQIELMQGLATKDPPRTLSIASYPIITMGRLVSDFYNRHPDGEISLKLIERRMQEVIELVENNEAEIGIVMSNHMQSKELRHMLHFRGLEFNILGTDTWYVNIGSGHPLYDREEIRMEELLPYSFVRMPDDYFSNLTFYLEIDGIRLSEFKRVVYLSDSAAILAMLQRTNVFRFGPGLSADDFAAYGIRTIPIQNCSIRITVGWIRRKRDMLSGEAREFVALLEKLYPSVL